MDTAFVAIADDPSAIVHNPAGLTALKGTHVYGGGSALTLTSTYESPQGQSGRTHFRVYFPPHQFLTSDFDLENMAFGLGVYSPFGIDGRTWSDDGLTRYVSTQSLVGTFPVNPTFAWRPLPDLSLGFGPDHVYAIGKAKRKINQSAWARPMGGSSSARPLSTPSGSVLGTALEREMTNGQLHTAMTNESARHTAVPIGHWDFVIFRLPGRGRWPRS